MSHIFQIYSNIYGDELLFFYIFKFYLYLFMILKKKNKRDVLIEWIVL